MWGEGGRGGLKTGLLKDLVIEDCERLRLSFLEINNFTIVMLSLFPFALSVLIFFMTAVLFKCISI